MQNFLREAKAVLQTCTNLSKMSPKIYPRWNLSKMSPKFFKSSFCCRITHICFGREVGENGTQHLWQIMGSFASTQKQFPCLQLVTGRYNIEAAKGSSEEAIIYCQKDSNFKENEDRLALLGQPKGQSNNTEGKKKGLFHSTPKIAYKPAIHNPISPFLPTRWLGPTQQAVGVGSAPCHCVRRLRRGLRDLGVDVWCPLSNSQGLQAQGSHAAL